MQTFEEFQATRVETDDIFSKVDWLRADEIIMLTNSGWVYDFNDIAVFVEKTEHDTFFTADGSDLGNQYDSLEDAERALYEFMKGEST